MISSRSLSTFYVSAAALGAGLMWSPTADACGGLFCDPIAPVIQTGEQIVFTVDPSTNQVHAIINISYVGEAEDFAWILPLQSQPTDIQVAPTSMFAAVNRLTTPQFNLTVETEGSCSERNFFRGGGDVAFDSESGVPTAAPQEPSIVLDRRAVGPYESVVLDSSSPEAVQTWLENNNYNVTDEMIRSVIPYIQKGDVLLALRLQKDQEVGDIQPIDLTMTGDEVCVPIRLTAIAAVQDMDITVTVLSNQGRAIPENYNHVSLNMARIDWWRRGANYREVVSEAADEGSGNAFVTEFAGSARIFDDQIEVDIGFTQDELLAQTNLNEVLDRLWSSQILFQPEAASIVTRNIPDSFFDAAGVDSESFTNCIPCWIGNFPSDGFDAQPLADEMWDRIIEPSERLQTMFDSYNYATRLYTLLSPEEMTIDPEFNFRSDLPDLSNQHNARAVIECGLGGDQNDSPIRVEISEIDEVLYFDGMAGLQDRAILDAMPAAVKVEQLFQGLEVQDNSPVIQDAIDRHNGTTGCGCSSDDRSRGTPGAMAIFMAAVGLVFLRRRRR